MQTVNVVIYRNGDMTKAFKTVPLEKQPKGTVINLATLNIADYYEANYSGEYDFYGWYNDGEWNNYKANPENPPAGLQTITVNGWTNIICMVYDYEKVIVKAITDDNKATETQLFSGYGLAEAATCWTTSQHRTSSWIGAAIRMTSGISTIRPSGSSARTTPSTAGRTFW